MVMEKLCFALGAGLMTVLIVLSFLGSKTALVVLVALGALFLGMMAFGEAHVRTARLVRSWVEPILGAPCHRRASIRDLLALRRALRASSPAARETALVLSESLRSADLRQALTHANALER